MSNAGSSPPRHAQRRVELKEAARRAVAVGAPDTAELYAALQRLPRDASPVRLRNRDATDGAPVDICTKGTALARVRDMAHRGELPGVHKSSW